MKSILYVGATLMIGASIYGFVDYKKSQDKAAFKNMYTEVKKAVEEPAADVKEPAINSTTDNQTKTATGNAAVKKAVANSNKKATKKIKKKRKVNVRLFSRGGLDDEYIEPVKKVSPLPQPVSKN